MTDQRSTPETADDFVRNLARLVGAMGFGRQQQDLQPEQQHLILQFRALRNGLGNYGRHGESPDRALIPSPEIRPSGGPYTAYTMTFVDVLPRTTARILLRYADREVAYDVEAVDPESWELPIPDQAVDAVVLSDVRGEPLAIGIPTFHDDRASQTGHGMTVTGEPLPAGAPPEHASGNRTGKPSNSKA
ncbi:MAG TPA: hypothetical protein VFJ94_15625 [Intrasporangium sp.]|uniref:hypothetical protein n=1 Tax=Intrasporangium sp. TaxID=1925024 RepID=UPI002D76DCFC|nr:hypothetical protein [Intrasporangium sp.]HET7399944.1 hypothetical protein [Intrasporangium sp.]